MKTHEIRNTAFTKRPINQPTEQKAGQLTQKQLDHFFDKGWLLLEDVIDKDILENVKVGVAAQVDELVDKLFTAGKITNKYEEEGFFQRMISVEKEFPDASVLLHKNGKLPEGVKELWSYSKLLNIAEQLIGPEVCGHPVWNLRVKLPEIESGVVPWHQDTAYFYDNACETMILTAWIPLLDTTEFNGGMKMMNDTHKPGIVAPHFCCAGGTWYLQIEDEVIEDTFQCNMKEQTTTCDVPYGGVLLFSNMIVHRSSSNRSNEIRWSLDLRWQDPSKPSGRDEKMPLMRSAVRPVKEIDWAVLNNRQQNDRKEFLKEDKTRVEKVLSNEFDTTLGGPWMKRWPIKHHNKHTQA